MSKIAKIEILKSIVENYPMKDDVTLSFNTDIQLNNGNIADFQIKKGVMDKIVPSFWMFCSSGQNSACLFSII